MSTPATVIEWITKEQAAEELHVSTRHIERLAAARNIPKRFEKPGGERRYGRTLYERSAITAISESRLVPADAPPRSLAVVPRAQVESKQVEVWGALAAHLARLSEAFPRPRSEPRAWLTLEEAVDHSGLPAGFVAELVNTSQVDSIGRGPKTWRIRRASLDAYGAGVYGAVRP